MQSGPGRCEVCGQVLHTIRALAGHLRHNPDPAHAAFKVRLQAEYRLTLWCRKCGQSWEVRDPAERNRKRCPSCEARFRELGKRRYEGLPTAPIFDAVSVSDRVRWSPGDDLYLQVVSGLETGERIRPMMRRLGITYKVLRAIGEHALGITGYVELTNARKYAVGNVNIRKAHEEYQALSPADKARRLKQLFGGTCTLERLLARQLVEQGVTQFKFNQWQAVPVEGRLVPREADLKVEIGDGRKLVVLCDGEAFHGPCTIFGDPAGRIASDRATAMGYFALGYSVARYSESEIHDGSAAMHVRQLLARLQSCRQVYRNWCPAEEATN